VSDTIVLNGTVEGALIRGSWSYPAGGQSGSMRMTREETIDLLAVRPGRDDLEQRSNGVLDDLF